MMLKSKVGSTEDDLYRNPNSGELPLVLNEFDESLLSFSSVINDFVRRYFACVPISSDILDEVVRYCEDVSKAQRLIHSVVASSVWICYPEKRNSHSRILKELISKFISAGVAEPLDDLYEALARSLDTSSDYGHRIYLNASGRSYIALKEKNEQLSLGATGLCCWQASCDLAHFLLGVGASFVRGHNVVELGAGCGLCGIALAASGLTNSVTLTDCNKHVLGLLEENLRNNFSQETMQQNKIMVTYFDWMTSMASELPIKPDLIVASDVVYDSEVVLSLARTIANLIEPNERTNTRCLIAGTVRNEDTLRTFISALETNGLKLDESFTFSDGTFTFEDGRCIIEPSLFPFVATLQCPTTFHWISSA